MRELVFLGTAESVLRERERCVQIIGEFLDELEMAAEIRTASDPFYIAPDSSSRTYFQVTAETKYEVSAMLPGNERLAIGSLNYHTDFFGRAFDIGIHHLGPAHSSCIGLWPGKVCMRLPRPTRQRSRPLAPAGKNVHSQQSAETLTHA